MLLFNHNDHDINWTRLKVVQYTDSYNLSNLMDELVVMILLFSNHAKQIFFLFCFVVLLCCVRYNGPLCMSKHIDNIKPQMR